MFTPFAFVKSSTPSGPSIVTTSLAFYINALNGDFEDTAGGQTGSEIGTVILDDNEYWKGFSTSSYFSYNTNTFNSPDDGGVTWEIWAFYSSSMIAAGIETPISIERNGGNDDYIFAACNGAGNANSIYTLLPQSDNSKTEFSTSAPITGSWVHVTTTKNSNVITTYVTPLNSVTISGSRSDYNDAASYGSAMRIGRPVDNSTGFAQGFVNGYIGLVRIYDIALTADQVLQNYNAEKSRFEAY
jgi:hypothetical protein